MANIFLTPTAEFKPFSYAEMLAPIAAYQEAYDAYDAQLNTLAEDAATKAFNFAAQDTKEKAQYDALMNRLKASADSLLTNGLNADIMREIRSINKDYRTSMIPIHQKMAKRSELAKEQRELLSSNPDLRFTVDYSTTSLDNITSSSSYGIINLDKIYKDTATEFAAKTSKIQRDDFDPIPIGSTGYYTVKTGYGYTPKEFENAFYGNSGSPKTDSDIYKFYKEKVDAINARTDISEDIKIEMADAVYRGMEAAAGEFTTKQIAGKTVKTDDKLSDAELQEFMNKAPKNSDFILDGTPYHKDNTGRVYKIGTQGTGDNGNNSNSKSRIGRPQQGVKITFKTKRGNPDEVKKQSTSTFDPKGVDTGNSKIVTYSELPLYAQQEIDNYRGEDVVENYVYMYNEKDNSLYIIPKDINVVENATIDLNAL